MSDLIRDDSKQDRDDGGPAFPHQHDKTFYDPANPDRAVQTIRGLWHGGMTVRDYFAAKAMAVLGNDAACWLPSPEQRKAGVTWITLFAAECYEIADAMIAERAK